MPKIRFNDDFQPERIWCNKEEDLEKLGIKVLSSETDSVMWKHEFPECEFKTRVFNADLDCKGLKDPECFDIFIGTVVFGYVNKDDFEVIE
jgi:hypothetical protein